MKNRFLGRKQLHGVTVFSNFDFDFRRALSSVVISGGLLILPWHVSYQVWTEATAVQSTPSVECRNGFQRLTVPLSRRRRKASRK